MLAGQYLHFSPIIINMSFKDSSQMLSVQCISDMSGPMCFMFFNPSARGPLSGSASNPTTTTQRQLHSMAFLKQNKTYRYHYCSH